MAIRFFDTCGHDYDTSTSPQNWVTAGNLTVNADITYGYTLNINTAFGARSVQAVPGVALASGILNLTMKFNDLIGNGFLLVGDSGGGIAIDGLGRLSYLGHVSPPIPSPTSWHTYEFKTAAGAGTATLEVRLDGNTVPFWSLSGLTSTSWNGVQFGLVNGASIDIASFVVQDLTGPAPANDYMGELKPFVLFPTADVGTPQWTNDFGGANYLQVNHRVAPGDAAFLHSQTPGDTDEYTIGAIPGDAVSIVGVSGRINAKKFAGGTRTLGFIIDDGSTQHVGADLAIASGSWEEYAEFYPENPITAAPWALADFTGLRIGMTVKS